MESEVRFDDTGRAFVARDDKALKKAGWLFRLMSKPFLVSVFSGLTLWSLKIGLPVRSLIRKTIFDHFCGGETLEESKTVVKELYHHKVKSILDYSVEGKDADEDFERTLNEVLRIIGSAGENSAIPYTSIKLTGLISSRVLENANDHKPLTATDQIAWDQGMERMRKLAQAGRDRHVPVFIDAEESWVQNSIDRIAELLMPEFNTEEAVVLTTLQMYRHDRLDYLERLLENAKKGNYRIGIKLVRGAYMEKENLRASQLGYISPIHVSKEAVDRDFDRAVYRCLEEIDRVILCAGTHNEASTLFLVNSMKELGLPNDHPHVFFSQLYGMSDHITYNLADKGYNVTKYVPYGPVRSVIPYLIRRAEENTAIAGQMGRELRLILEEKQRRKEQRLLGDTVDSLRK